MDKNDVKGAETEPSFADLLSTAEAAEVVGLTKHTMDQYRSLGRGPRFLRFGRSVLYRRADLEDYLAGRGASDGR